MQKNKISKKTREDAITALQIAASSGYINAGDLAPETFIRLLCDSEASGDLAARAYYDSPSAHFAEGDHRDGGLDYAAEFAESAALLEDGWSPGEEYVRREAWDPSWLADDAE